MSYQSVTNTLSGDFDAENLTVDDMTIEEYIASKFASSLDDSSTDDIQEGATNLYWTETRFDTRLALKSTDDIAEGLSNLYWTDGRFDIAYADALTNTDTDDLAEGTTNLYWTDARFDTRLATKTTTDIAEGANLYWTDFRFETNFDARLSTKTTTDIVEGANEYWTQARFDTAFAAAIVSSTVVDDVVAALDGEDLSVNTLTTENNGPGVRMNGVDHCFSTWYANGSTRTAYMGKPSGGSILFSLVVEEDLSLLLQSGNASTYFQASDANLARWYLHNTVGGGDVSLDFGDSVDNDAGRIRFDNGAGDKHFDFYVVGSVAATLSADEFVSKSVIVAEDGINSQGSITIDWVSGNAPQLVLKDDEGTENGVIRMPDVSDGIGNDTLLIQNKQGQADMVFTTENGGDFRFCQDYSTDSTLQNYSFYIGHWNLGSNDPVTDPFIQVGNSSGNINSTSLKLVQEGNDFELTSNGTACYLYGASKFWLSVGVQTLLGNDTSVTNIRGSEINIVDGPLDTGSYLPQAQFAQLTYNTIRTMQDGSASADMLPALNGSSEGGLFRDDTGNEDVEYIGDNDGNHAKLTVNMRMRPTGTPDGARFYVQLRKNGSTIRTGHGEMKNHSTYDNTVSVSFTHYEAVSYGDKFTIYTYTTYGIDLTVDYEGDLTISTGL